jgi:hypothetical protein
MCRPYIDTNNPQVKIRKKRWNNKEIKKFYWKLICKQKVRKKGVGKSVPRAPVSQKAWLSSVTTTTMIVTRTLQDGHL